MSLLFNTLFAWKCSSTHHKLAMDALRLLHSTDSEKWTNLFLKHADAYLEGSKAPDNSFKDFRNHVLQIPNDYWGGAVKKSAEWYEKTVTALRQRQWRDAIYNAGVLSHYYTDPIMPLHTAQSEREGSVHRACEWSIAKSYEALRALLVEQLGGWPDLSRPTGDEWLAAMVRQGAETSYAYYDTILDHYKVRLGAKNPPAGLDNVLKDCLARLIGHAAVGFARILDQAIIDSGETPPHVNLTLDALLATLAIPVRWVTKKMEDAKERAVVETMVRELEETGKVVKNLPEDDREVRRLHAKENLKISLTELDAQKPEPTGTKFGTAKSTATPQSTTADVRTDAAHHPRRQPPKRDAGGESNSRLRYYLDADMPVEKAPSIGPKTASRLEKIGIHTVADLLAADVDQAAEQLDVRHIKADTLRTWQAQAQLMCDVPCLRVHDVQILVGGDITTAQTLQAMQPNEVLMQIEPFLQTKEGQWAIRSGKKPDLEEVTSWIAWANHSRSSTAA